MATDTIVCPWDFKSQAAMMSVIPADSCDHINMSISKCQWSHYWYLLSMLLPNLWELSCHPKPYWCQEHPATREEVSVHGPTSPLKLSWYAWYFEDTYIVTTKFFVCPWDTKPQVPMALIIVASWDHSDMSVSNYRRNLSWCYGSNHCSSILKSIVQCYLGRDPWCLIFLIQKSW